MQDISNGAPVSCRSASRRVALLGTLGSALLVGCVAVPADVLRAEGPPAERSAESELLFEILGAELAGRRGALDLAAAGYLRAAEATDDVRVAERATQLALFSRRWAEAERAARRWQSLDADAVQPQEALAQALLRQGNAEGAAEAFVEIVERRDAAASATLAEIASALLQGGGRVPTGAVLDALIERYPDSVPLRLARARVQLRAGEREPALATVDAVIVSEPDSAEARLLRAEILMDADQTDRALAELERAVAERPGDVRLRLGFAERLSDAGRYERLSEALERVYELAADDGGTLFTIGLLALDARRLDAAARYLDALLETGELTDEAHFYRARIDDQRRRHREALSHYEAVGPGELYVDARLRAAELLALTGQLQAGRDRLRELARSVPDPSLKPRLIMSEARMLEQADRAGEAVEVLSEGLQTFDGHPDLLYARAIAADAAERPDMLVADLRTLIERDPDHAHALNALGYHFAVLGERLDEAETLLEKANRLEPNDAAILDSLGWLRYRQGRHDDALRLLRQAHDLYPDAEIAAHLGEVLWVVGREQEAREVWNAALALAPDDDQLNAVVDRFTE